MRVIGLMSGTSLDGIDAALIEIAGRRPRLRPGGYRTFPYPDALRGRLLAAAEGQRMDAGTLARLHAAVGQRLARAVLDLCRALGVSPARVALVGAHGHTIHHA